MNDDISISWRGKEIGWMQAPQIDHSIIYGKWQGNETPESEAFYNLASEFSYKEVYLEPQKGTRVKCKDKDYVFHGLVLGIFEGEISIRRIIHDEQIQWLIEHVD